MKDWNEAHNAGQNAREAADKAWAKEQPKAAAPSKAGNGLYTAGDLQWMDFPPLHFTIPGYLVEGLTILVGKPKLGKSWMALDWLLAIAHGGHAFGTLQCDAGHCLYMALEDSPRRLQRRIKQLLPHSKEWSSRLTFSNKMSRLDNGGLDEIREWARSVPTPRLVVVDTFARVRPAREKNEGPYDADYRHMSVLQELATQLGIAIVVIHHQRKLDSDDPLDTASGSTGLTGAADSILVLKRDGQGITLFGRGRDIDDIEAAMSFDKTSGRWEVMGDAQEVRRSEGRTAIMTALANASAPMTPAEIAIMTGMERSAVDVLLHRMMKSGEVLSKARGRYAHPDKA